MIYRAVLLFIFLSAGITVCAQGLDAVQPVENTVTKELINSFKIEAPAYVIGSQEVDLRLVITDATGRVDTTINGTYNVTVQGIKDTLAFEGGSGSLKTIVSSGEPIQVQVAEIANTFVIRHIPAWLSILPPLIAIAMALVFKEVVISLFTGIFSGALILGGFQPSNWIPALMAVVDKYILQSLLDTGHLSVILFSMTIGGMVAVISRNGGMSGIVEKLSKYARSPRSTQLITWFLGIAIFFDDYANTLIVGNTMRPVTDRYRISREKLAYLVDSTAAPVAAIAFVTTWIGAEIGYIKDASKALGIEEGAYSMFLNSLQYAFYPVFTLVFMLMLVLLKKDFSKMFEAETRARTTGLLNPAEEGNNEAASEALKAFEPVAGASLRWYNALLPVVTVVGVTLAGLIITGTKTSAEQLLAQGVTLSEASFSTVWSNLGHLSDTGEASALRKLGILIGNSDAYVALLWSSLSGLLLGVVLTVTQGIMSLHRTIDSLIDGFKAMIPAMLILTFAWALSKVTEDLHTADFITSLFSGNVSPWLMPSLTFLLAAVISFSTGSSWGTMAILYPLILPATWALSASAGMDEAAAMQVMYNVISVVLAGAVFGDHCSPISDTTILSSLSSGCNHIAHVKTQFPYALTVGLVSIFVNIVLVNLGLPWYINFSVGILILFLIVKYLGKEVKSPVSEPQETY
jgi:Na+/H+ antiporter NhaC